MKRRRSSSSEAAAPGPSRSGRRTGGTLSYDVALPYAAEEDRRLFPRLRVGVQLFDEQAAIIDATPLLDTGAEISVFDGGFAVHAGWSMAEVAARALDVRPIYGLTRRGAAVDGYLHEITCYVGVGAHVAELRVRALITLPK